MTKLSRTGDNKHPRIRDKPSRTGDKKKTVRSMTNDNA